MNISPCSTSSRLAPSDSPDSDSSASSACSSSSSSSSSSSCSSFASSAAVVAAAVTEVNMSDPRRQGKFFVEWRVVDPSIATGIEHLQTQVRQLYPQALMSQSCASDNMHITMNELTLNSSDEINRALAVVKEVERAFASGPSIQLQVAGLGHFDKKVMYAQVQSEGKDGDVLGNLYTMLDQKFKAAHLQPKTRPFVAHLTICKAGKNSTIPAAVLSLKPGILGTQTLNELHFCIKRLPDEPTPPVIYTLRK